MGSLPQQKRSPSSRWTGGSLTKFKEYCEQFSRNSSHQNKQHVNLHMTTHQAWLMAIDVFELLTSLYPNRWEKKSLSSPLFLLPLKRAFHGLQMRFNQISRHIPRIINAYRDNENVIFYLLNKRCSLSEIYGQDFLYKRFKFPVKASELIELLVNRYQERELRL